MFATPTREACAEPAEVTAEAELDALRSQMKALMRAIAYVDAEAPRLEKEARTAWRKCNQGSLTHARSTLVDWLMVGGEVAAMRDDVRRFRAAHPDLGGERGAIVQRLDDDLQRAADRVARLAMTVRELVALGPVPTRASARVVPQPELLKARFYELITLPFVRRIALIDA